MYLTQEEERALAGESGEALQMAHRVLLAVGKLSNASKLIPIQWAHIAGISYLTIGDEGLAFIKGISNQDETSFKVRTTVNPCSIDTKNWARMGTQPEYIQEQFEIISCFRKLGMEDSFTCLPYQLGDVPDRGAHVAWSESSASIYANSILGLMTHRESAISAIASALTGKTVLSGLHLTNERKPMKNIRVRIGNGKILNGSLDFGTLGYFAGKQTPGVIGFVGMGPKIEVSEAKALCAGIGTSGNSGMFVLDSRENVETIDFTERERADTLSALSDCEHGDAIVLGCPQMTVEEIRELDMLLAGKQLKKKCLIFCSSKNYNMAKTNGCIDRIEASGAMVIRDACPDSTPLISALGVDSVETDSCKGAYYMKRVYGVRVALKETKEIVAQNAN